MCGHAGNGPVGLEVAGLDMLAHRFAPVAPALVIPTLIEVAERSAPEQREPAPALMLRAVVQHVAALAERLQVRGPVVGWIVIEMRAGQNHAGRSDSPLPQPQRG